MCFGFGCIALFIGKVGSTDYNCSDFIRDASVQLLLNVVSVIDIDKGKQ